MNKLRGLTENSADLTGVTSDNLPEGWKTEDGRKIRHQILHTKRRKEQHLKIWYNFFQKPMSNNLPTENCPK